MTFEPNKVNEFTALFEDRKDAIKAFTGCNGVQLLREANDGNVFFTYSTWNSEEDLNHYRFSAFFKDTWGKTKALFAAKPEAWSLTIAG
jgi:heme-degrading monooxygenase HmoA